MELDKAALDRWITREPPEDDEDEEERHVSNNYFVQADNAALLCNYCGKDACECDKLQAEQEADAQRLIY